jgi:4-alpha-glucanotransferase
VGVNLPGTDTERPNWRLRLPVPVEALLQTASARAILDRVRASGRGTAVSLDPANQDIGDLNGEGS